MPLPIVTLGLGRVDVVVAYAGIGGEAKPSAEYSEAAWHQVIGVTSTAFYTQRAGIRESQCPRAAHADQLT